MVVEALEPIETPAVGPVDRERGAGAAVRRLERRDRTGMATWPWASASQLTVRAREHAAQRPLLRRRQRRRVRQRGAARRGRTAPRDFVVYGGDDLGGLVQMEHTVEVARRRWSGDHVSATTPELPLSPKARKMRGPSAFGGDLAALLEPDLDDRASPTSAVLLRLGAGLPVVADAAAAVLRRALRRVLADAAGSASNIRDYPVVLLLNIVLFSFFGEATGAGGGVDGGARAARAQDALPAHGDPARDRADLARSTCC